jgi:OmpA-OmpF porin, OOP family
VKEFDAFEFRDTKGQQVTVEGRYTEVMYLLNEGATEPSRLQIHRNYENAVKKIGGTAVYNDGEGGLYLKIVKDGKEYYAKTDTYITSQYVVKVLQKEAMKQYIEANAAVFKNDLKSTGHAAIYGIYFDTAKAEIKPESGPALDEIAKLLKGDPTLKTFIVGHTDSVGDFESNMKLSQARAQAVMQSLASKYGIEAVRLRAYGVSSLSPMQSNDTEEGRAKNRRVELVRQ